MLRIVSKCQTLDNFVAVFHPYVTRDAVFIATRQPRLVGQRARFAITLNSGATMLSGDGEVVEAYQDDQNVFKRPGMRMRFVSVDATSQVILQRLLDARTPPPNKHGRPAAHHVPDTPEEHEVTLTDSPPYLPLTAPGASRSGGPAMGPDRIVKDVPLPYDNDGDSREEPLDEKTAALANALAAAGEQIKEEERRKGSDFILPANPFGELSDASLQAFVECTIYEETGSTELPQDDDNESLPEDDSEVPTAVVEAPRAAPDTDGEAEVAPGASAPAMPEWWPPQNVAAERADRARSPSLSTFLAGDPAAAAPQPPPAVMPSVAVPNVVKVAVIAAAGSAVVTLFLAYLLWGGSDRPEPDSKTVAATPDAVEIMTPTDASPAAAQTAPVGVGATAGEPANADKSSIDDASKTATQPSDPSPPDPDNGEVEPDGPVVIDEPPAVDPSGPAPTVTPGTDTKPDGECRLSVVTRPAGATVSVGGKRLGTTPGEFAMRCGRARVILRRARYDSEHRIVKLTPSKTGKVIVRLERPKHRLRITSSPPGATVTVGGRRVGRTPVSASVKGFLTTSVRVSRRGYSGWSRRIYARRKSMSVHAKLKRAGSSRSRRSR